MSLTEETRHGIGGNIPPVTPPSELDLLADLDRRYPKIKPRLAEFEGALKTFPEQIKDETVAKELQDLLGQMKDERSAWKGQRSEQKKPWDKLAKVVMNFFGTAEEKIEEWEKVWRPRLDAYMDEKRAAAQRAAEEEARKERERAETARKEAEAAEARRIEAERQAQEAVEREERAKREAAEADARRKEAEAAAARAAEESRRIEAEKKARERAERERNAEMLKQIKPLMKQAAKLHDDGVTDETSQDDIERLDALIRPGGLIGVLANQVFASTLLSHEELVEIEIVRQALGNMRQVLEERLGAKERKRRERERLAADAAAARLAAEREKTRKADEEAAAIARADREASEEAAARAKKDAAEARREATAARRDANEAHGDLKAAIRSADRADEDAGRVENRAGRMERRVENSTDADFSRTRGDLGTVGSQGRRWARYVVDEAALRNVCGPLGPFLTSDALEGATFQVMRSRQSGFTGELVTLPELPGVEFRYERDLTIRT